MNYLSAESISKSFGERWLFEKITLGISQGQKVALVGANGSGKSTLLKVLSGNLPPDTGDVQVRKEIRPGFLLQDPDLDDNAKAIDCLYQKDNPVAKVVLAYKKLLEKPDADADAMQQVLEKMEEANAWDYDAKVEEIAGKLGITDLEQPVSTMSGGQKKRLALAQLLLSEPDLLILDEPTNHLDIEAIEWLEKYLEASTVTLLMVTHDRYFMDNVTNTIFELENGNLYTHEGKYADYLEKKANREEIERVEVEKAQNLYKKELDWMRRQPKARGTKAKYRVDAFEGVEKKAKTNLKKDEMLMDVKQARQGKKILEVKNISKSFGDKTLITDFSYMFKKNECIGIIGKNGTGKSTFLNMITGRLEPDSGEIIVGPTTKFGYFTQESVSLNTANRVVDEIKEIAEYIELGNGKEVSASKLLELFLFTPEKQYTYIEKLSGGEKKRLQLLKVLITQPNFLILDEPTNDLDLDTMNVLETFLDSFNGCLMIVSHDRYFMDRLVDHLFVFEEGNIRDFNGNYTDYREDEKQKALSAAKQSTGKQKKDNSSAPSKPKNDKSGASFKEKQEYKQLEKDIATLEAKRKGLEEKLDSGETDHTILTEWGDKVAEISDEIEEKTMRWLELSELPGVE